jgi:hypothetical protein
MMFKMIYFMTTAMTEFDYVVAAGFINSVLSNELADTFTAAARTARFIMTTVHYHSSSYLLIVT